jgi:hypothetical protein
VNPARVASPEKRAAGRGGRALRSRRELARGVGRAANRPPVGARCGTSGGWEKMRVTIASTPVIVELDDGAVPRGVGWRLERLPW